MIQSKHFKMIENPCNNVNVINTVNNYGISVVSTAAKIILIVKVEFNGGMFWICHMMLYQDFCSHQKLGPE